jgi:hypothetical protein
MRGLHPVKDIVTGSYGGIIEDPDTLWIDQCCQLHHSGTAQECPLFPVSATLSV